MKYHSSNIATEATKSTLTIYTESDHIDKMGSTEPTMVRCELEIAQRALKLQTRRCRQLVSEFTRKLQDKELQVMSERRLRDQQLTNVLRSLLVFEARLKQEQTFIRHQLQEKDSLIQRQRKELRRLRLTLQYCASCSQAYGGSNVDSCDSSSEYYVGSHDAWDSSSELYGSVSECGRPDHSSGEDAHKNSDEDKLTYEKNKYNKVTDGTYRRCKKSGCTRRTTGTYFEVLKIRESSADSSAEEVSSDLSDPHKTKEKIEQVSGRIEQLFNDTYSERMDSLHGIKRAVVSSEEQTSSLSASSECDTTVVSSRQTTAPDVVHQATPPDDSRIYSEITAVQDNLQNEEKELSQTETSTNKSSLITDTIRLFDVGEQDGEQNENWYASASDQEDDEHRDIYRNNPVLECMNQILLQNINDSINSPPKSPELERNPKAKTQKRVKFSDESTDIPGDVATNAPPRPSEPADIPNTETTDYYETPIQAAANFYEVPQSIYSNDYEQILSKCGDKMHGWTSPTVKIASPTSKLENMQENKINRMATQKLTLAKSNKLDDLEMKNQHYYIDMDTRCSTPYQKLDILKRTKVSRVPPALPPKPANLVSKLKIQSALHNRSCETLDDFSIDSEPDYCSISELNLPTENMIMSKGHPIPSATDTSTINKSNVSLYDPISLNGTLSSLVAKNVEKNSMPVAKQSQVKTERIVSNMASIAQINMLKNKREPEIPKLPQVSEIIIPEETDENKKVEHISQDNYIKNNSQLLKQKSSVQSPDKLRNRIVIGTSVSNLVSSFNNQQILSQINTRKTTPEKLKFTDRLFSNFDFSQNYEKQRIVPEKIKTETPSFEKFDLSQNFEEFNLDDCEIGEEYQSEASNSLNYNVNVEGSNGIENQDTTNSTSSLKSSSGIENEHNFLSDVEPKKVVETKPVVKEVGSRPLASLQQLQKSLSQRSTTARLPEPSYEHFLECTGLSSKSILTPSRMLTNHKSMLKPKDIKLRSRAKSTAVFEQPTATIKYWSEPYL